EHLPLIGIESARFVITSVGFFIAQVSHRISLCATPLFCQLYYCPILGGFVSAQLMNCRGRGGTDFYRFLCLRLVRSGTVADRATPCAPAPKGTFRSNNRH